MALSLQSVERARDRTSKYVIGRAGRPPGALNNINSDVRDMILRALNKAGGERYLHRQAIENPTAFMALVGRILPKEVVTEGHTTIALHLLAAQAISAELLEGQAEPPRPEQPMMIDHDVPTE